MPEISTRQEYSDLDSLTSITSVVGNFQFFVAEKWSIASDKSGSGNTANIGSINKIDDITQGKGMFSKLGEEWFDDYWMNYKNHHTRWKRWNEKRSLTLRILLSIEMAMPLLSSQNTMARQRKANPNEKVNVLL